MLTIKHVLSWGYETIYTAKEVRAKLLQPGACQGLAVDDDQFVAFDRPDGSVHKITSGTVYVMNDTGRTVSKYELKDSSGVAQDLNLYVGSDGVVRDESGREVLP